MRTEFRKANLRSELRSLMTFDRKVFSSADTFDADTWKECQAYWMLVDAVKVGCCAFQHHVDFQDDIKDSVDSPTRKGSLYISTTGILPRFQGTGLGVLLKAWEISYARYHGFTRIVTNTRGRNTAMINLNRKFGFRILRTTAGYYEDPTDAVVVMEVRIRRARRARTLLL
jgi:ribosomal protein S18 acetylase RimI-like enzyme